MARVWATANAMVRATWAATAMARARARARATELWLGLESYGLDWEPYLCLL